MRGPISTLHLLPAVILVALLVGNCSDDSSSPRVDPPLPEGQFAGTLYVSFTGHGMPVEDHEQFTVEVDSAGTITISEETISYSVSYTDDEFCEISNSGSVQLTPVASIIVENRQLVITMVLSGPWSTTDRRECPDGGGSELLGSGNYSGACSFTWEDALGDGAYYLIENDEPNPGFGEGTEFRLILRLSPAD